MHSNAKEIVTIVETTKIESAEDLAAYFARGGVVHKCAIGERSIAPGEAPVLDEEFDTE